MHIPINLGYFALTVPFAAVWIVLFLASKSTRREQLLMSIIAMPWGPISEIVYFKDYWFPKSILSFSLFGHPVLIEDFIFAFAIGGIGAVIYEALFKKHQARRAMHYSLSLLIIIVIGASSFVLLWQSGLNSIFASAIAFLILAFLIIVQRKDLLMDSIISGLAVMIVMFFSYFFLIKTFSNSEEFLQNVWFLYKTPLDIRILGIPLTEMIWGFSWGMLAGPLYEFWKRIKLR